jgi:hypothetical protein
MTTMVETRAVTGGTVASYCISCRGVSGFGFGSGRKMGRVDDALAARGFEFGGEVDVFAAGGAAPGG